MDVVTADYVRKNWSDLVTTTEATNAQTAIVAHGKLNKGAVLVSVTRWIAEAAMRGLDPERVRRESSTDARPKLREIFLRAVGGSATVITFQSRDVVVFAPAGWLTADELEEAMTTPPRRP